MNDQPTLDLGSPTSTQVHRKWVNERVSLGIEGDLCVVFAGSVPVVHYHAADEVGKRHAIALLTETRLARVNDVASTFATDRTTIFRTRRKYEQGGVSALVSVKRGPREPHKLGAERTRQLVKLKEQRLPNTVIAQRLGVTEGAIRRRLKQLNLSPRSVRQLGLEIAGDTASVSESSGQPQLSTAAAVAVANPEPAESSGQPQPSTAAAVAVANPEPAELSGQPQPSTPAAVAVANPEPAVENVRALAEEATGERWASSGDREPTDRRVDRLLARMGLLEDAAPLFASGQRVDAVGVLLALPALVSSGVFETAKKVYGSLGPAFYGLRTTVLVLLLMALMRIRRAERLKQHAPSKLGAVLGLDRAPEVKTLRRKLTQLAARGKAHEFVRQLAEIRVGQEQEALGFLYVDGHVRAYNGKRQLAKGFVSRRRLAMPATTDYWVNDLNGQPLFVVTARANEALSRMLEPVLKEVRSLLGERRVTVVFDRGGWSPKLFERLLQQGFDILTYRKFKRRRLPASRFREQRVTLEGRELSYQLCEQAVRLGTGRLRLRQIVRRTENGHQTALVTSRWDLPAAELAYRMFERWRQENYFKYMREEYELDGLVDYQIEPDDPQREVPHPRRKELERQRREARAEVAELERQYGAFAAAQSERADESERSSKKEQARLRQALREAQDKVGQLTKRLKKVPRRVRLGELPERAGTVRLSFERKHLTDALKMVAYQAETVLYNQLASHYARCAEDGRKLLTEAFSASGSLREDKGKLIVELDPLSSPHRTRALEGLCAELNNNSVRFPGSSLSMEYRVART